MKQTKIAILLLFIALICQADERCIICMTDSGEVVLNHAESLKLNGKSVTLIGADRVLAVIQFCNHARKQNIEIKQIDISKPQYVEVKLNDGKIVRISWLEMGKDSALSSADLDERLARLSSLIRLDQSNRVSTVDLYDFNKISSMPATSNLDAQSVNVVNRGSSHITYVVNKGDTISTVAALFGISKDKLIEANVICDDKQLEPGQTIVIPVGVRKGVGSNNSSGGK